MFSRREFITLLGLGGGVAVSPLRFLVNGHNPFTLLDTPQYSAFPIGRRPVRLRALVENSAWTAPNHVAQDFIGWVQDLKPDTLPRFFSGPQTGNLPLGQASGYPNPNETMTVLEFIQACLSACSNVNSTTLFPRLNMNDYKSNGMTQFIQDAQSIWNISSKLNPPQTLLSLDNWEDNEYTDGEATSIINNLQSVGFQGFSCGANAAQGIPNGLATFVIADYLGGSGTALTHLEATLSQQPSIMMGFEELDFPGPLNVFAQHTPDVQADKITAWFQSQGQIGSVPFYYLPYLYWSDINAAEEPACPCNFAYDATQIFTSPSGPYGGESLYEITKALMNQYNPVSPVPEFPSVGGVIELSLLTLSGLALMLRDRKRRGKQVSSNDLTKSRNSE